MYRLIISMLPILIFGTAIPAQDFAPFVIPVDQSPESELVFDYQPLNESDRLTAKGEDFISNEGKAIRIWGVNMSFGACFPSHSDAERLAKRLAGAGINSVRLHHMDSAKWPRGIWDNSGTKFHPEALDRLDYFIDQLAECGIYSNINLHVGKEHSTDLNIAAPKSYDLRYDKMISIFTPEIIEAQKRYARALLTHKNKYRGVRYADDYAIGFVEITNENSLFMWSAAATLPNLPEYYAKLLQNQYNHWLKTKYTSDHELVQAWLSQSVPLENNILLNSELSNVQNNQVKNWMLEQHDQARATISSTTWKDKECIEIKPENIDGISWHLQFNQRDLKIEVGKPYTVSFYAAAAKPREVSLSVMENHADWQNLGLAQTVKLDKSWNLYRYNFIAKQNDKNARIGFIFGKDDTEFYLANIIMQPGVEYKMSENESLENMSVELYKDIESPTRTVDRMMFYAETEKSYFDGMYKYIKEELGCRANVTGTIVFGPLGLWAQSNMDYIDSHAYWKHPNFPGKPWDSGNWIIQQQAMSDFPQGSTLAELSSERLAGKPYTVSEYNHPAPLDSQAECVPMIASWAARQDWNGVWLYTYSHSNEQWDRNYINSYFDVDTNPAKWGFVRFGASAFRSFALKEYKTPRKFELEQNESPMLESLAKTHARHDRNMKALFKPDIVSEMEGLDSWHDGVYIVSDGSCGVYAGNMASLSESENSTFKFKIDSPGSAVISINPLTGNSKYLITACGRSENVDMIFSDNRNTVGKNWGSGPAQIESVKGYLEFKELNLRNWKCYALYPDGTIREEVKIEKNKILLDPKHETMWYLLQKNK